MKFIPHLNFDGDCEEAFNFYAQVLGAQPATFFRFGGSPMTSHFGPEWDKKIMHAALHAGDQILIGADAPPQYFQQPQGFSVCLDLSNEAEAERVFAVLSEGGKVTMPIQETFWAKRFAQFIDRFGTPWMINVAKPM